MKRISLLIALVAVGVCPPGIAHAEPDVTETPGILGVDVSNWTGEIDWAAVTGAGGAFAFVYASEGVNYRNPLFKAQEDGAAEAGLIRGAYHFAQPHESDGATQADFFVDSGGGWTADGRTLPGALDVEDNPYTDRNGLDSCYGLNQWQMVAWLNDFTSRYRQRTGRDAIIYTTTNWWQTCTGNSAIFGHNPLWLARWGAEPGALPAGWPRQTFWQAADRGAVPGGQNIFNGTVPQLRMLAQPPAEVAAAGRRTAGNTYTVTVLNTGSTPATRIAVTGRPRGDQKIVKAGPGCRFSGRTVDCVIAELGPGGKTELNFTTEPHRSGRDGRAGGDGKADGVGKAVRDGRDSKGYEDGRAGGDGKVDRDGRDSRVGRDSKDSKDNKDSKGYGEGGAGGGSKDDGRGRADGNGRAEVEDRERGVRITIGTVDLTVPD